MPIGVRAMVCPQVEFTGRRKLMLVGNVLLCASIMGLGAAFEYEVRPPTLHRNICLFPACAHQLSADPRAVAQQCWNEHCNRSFKNTHHAVARSSVCPVSGAPCPVCLEGGHFHVLNCRVVCVLRVMCRPR